MVLAFLRGLLGSKPARRVPGERIGESSGVRGPFTLPRHDDITIEAISEHVRRHIGPTHEVLHERISDIVHIDVLPVPPTPTQPYWTFVTCGMSDRPMEPPKGAEAWRHAELMIRLPPDWPVPEPGDADMTAWQDPRAYWPIRVLKMLALFPHSFRCWIWTGHTLELGEPGASTPGAGFNSVLIMPPLTLPEAVWTLPVSADRTIHFFTVIPLYREESDLKIEHGLDSLLDLFPEDPADVEIVRPDRRNLAGGPAGPPPGG